MVVDRCVWPIAGEERANDPVVQKVVDQVIGGSHSFANEKIGHDKKGFYLSCLL